MSFPPLPLPPPMLHQHIRRPLQSVLPLLPLYPKRPSKSLLPLTILLLIRILRTMFPSTNQPSRSIFLQHLIVRPPLTHTGFLRSRLRILVRDRSLWLDLEE